jgi:nonribosomal peptide synthetase protein BlmVI
MRTGDLGYLHEGELVVTGRLKDMVILRGRNYYPADLEEAAALSHPAIDPAGVAAFGVDGADGERLVLACEIRRDSRRGLDPVQAARAVQGALAAALEVRADHMTLVRPGGLPRTTSGKVSRSAARAAWLAGALPLVAQGPAPPRSAASLPLLECVARMAGRPVEQLGIDWTLGELGIDSLRRVELALTLEHELGLAVPLESLAPELRLDELLRILTPLGQEAPATREGETRSVFPPSPNQAAYLALAGDLANEFFEIVYLRVPPALDADALERALAWIAQRHPALRLRFASAAGEWRAMLRTDGPAIGLSRLTVAGVTESGRRWRELLLERVRAAVDVEHGALAHAVWFDRGLLEHGVLALALHHLVVDAVSVSIIVTTLQQAYQRLCRGHELAAAREDGYLDWLLDQPRRAMDPALAASQRDWLGHETARRQQPAAGVELDAAARFSLSAFDNDRFLARFADSRARHDALLAALTQAWAEASGEACVHVLLEHHGRGGAGEAPPDAVGWMVNFYSLALTVAPDSEKHYERTRAAHTAVPVQGAGFEAGAQMASLPPAKLGFVYRGAVDEGFRRDSVFGLLSVDQIYAGWRRVRERAGLSPQVEVLGALAENRLVCTVTTRLLPAGRAASLAAAMELCLVRLLDA